MTTYEWISSIIGVTQCGLIGYGLRSMRMASETRDREGARRYAATMEGLEKRYAATMEGLEKRHAATMEGLEKRYAATMAAFDKSHAATMAGFDKSHAVTMAGFEDRSGKDERRHAESMTALKELIERTGRATA